MQPAYEQYRPGCRMISLLTNLEVQLFDAVRIEEAKYMLEQGDESVAKIAFSVGYNDPNYFSKVFTKLEHMTPHDYRKRRKG
ncbi:MAG TPA: helix-turn-helix transcriptional regulator [Ktedonobacteraceae bacterium]|nr:helix-turn-helix transcriptional regulator [Ktedonobacteraceae bacterium]